MCSKCSKTRRLVPANADSIAYSKLHTLYTSCQSPASFGSRASLKKYPNCSNEQVDKYLQKNETYSKCKQSRKNFLCLKVQTFRLNEIWSVDLADMQQLARPNNGVKFLFVAVDTLSRFLWVRPIKRKTADSCRNALKQITSDIKDESPKMQCSHFFNVLPEVPLQCPESWKKFGWTRAENWLEHCIILPERSH